MLYMGTKIQIYLYELGKFSQNPDHWKKLIVVEFWG